MKTTRKENEFVLTTNDIIYSLPFWAILFFAAFISALIAQNYFMASIFCFLLIKYFWEDKVHFYENRFSQFILNNYLYSTKWFLLLPILAISIMLSWFSLKAFICSIVISIIYNEYMKAFAKRKSLT